MIIHKCDRNFCQAPLVGNFSGNVLAKKTVLGYHITVEFTLRHNFTNRSAEEPGACTLILAAMRT